MFYSSSFLKLEETIGEDESDPIRDVFNPMHTSNSNIFDKTILELQNTLKRLQSEIAEVEVSYFNNALVFFSV